MDVLHRVGRNPGGLQPEFLAFFWNLELGLFEILKVWAPHCRQKDLRCSHSDLMMMTVFSVVVVYKISFSPWQFSLQKLELLGGLEI